MKKLGIFLALFTTISLASCGNDIDNTKIALDYGYFLNGEINTPEDLEAENFSYSDLTDMIDNKESFVLLLYHNKTCGCWSYELGPSAIKFMKKYNVKFHAFDNAKLDGKDKTYGLYEGTAAMPGVAFFRRGKLIRQVIYGKLSNQDKKIFSDSDRFEQFMLQNIYLPKMYYINKDMLEAKMSESTAEFNLYVALTKCPDCARVENEYIHSWVDKNAKNTLSKPFYVFDIYPYNDPSTTNDIRDFCRLGDETNPKFGYTYGKHGFVPTFQTWKNGEITDMVTVLNDFADNTGKVTSYFNSLRIANSPLLSRMNYMVYDGTTISTELVTQWGSVKQDEQVKWHMPAVKAFFEEYIK